MQFLENLAGIVFVVSEAVLAFGTPVLLVVGIIGWGAIAMRGEVGWQVVTGLAANLELALMWAALFGPVFLPSMVRWPEWMTALDAGRGPAFFLTAVFAAGIDVFLWRSYRRATAAGGEPHRVESAV